MKRMALYLGLLLWAAALVVAVPGSGTAAELTVSDAAVGTGVENLAPQGVAESFDVSVEKLYAFTRILGAQGETIVKHLWFLDDNLMAEVELFVNSPSWRTYSSKAILPSMAGQWRVDVTAEDGTVIQSMPFTVQ